MNIVSVGVVGGNMPGFYGAVFGPNANSIIGKTKKNRFFFCLFLNFIFLKKKKVILILDHSTCGFVV